MIDERYITIAKNTVSAFDPERKNRYFVFGSSTRKKRFGDVDIGVVGNAKHRKDLAVLRDRFEESTFPYFVDVVDFNEASEEFARYVKRNENLVWID